MCNIGMSFTVKGPSIGFANNMLFSLYLVHFALHSLDPFSNFLCMNDKWKTLIEEYTTNNLIVVEVKAGIPTVIHIGWSFQSRHTSTIKMIHHLYATKSRLCPQDIVFCVYSGDSSTAFKGDHPFLAYSQNPAAPNAKAIPDFVFDHWSEARLPPFFEFYECSKGIGGGFENKWDTLFWIGANTHSIREQIVGDLSEEPGCQVTMMDWSNMDSGYYTDMYTHGQYKYLLDMPGNGYSGRLKYLLLLGSVVFVVERDDTEWWWDVFQPWVHFVPVMADGSDLMGVLQVIRTNPTLARTIAAAGTKLAQLTFEHNNVYTHFATTLNSLYD